MNSSDKTTIFLVEDNNVLTMALKADIETTFANIPITIHSFETGEACMEKFKIKKPQIVILDYHLNSKFPDAADGVRVLDWIKKEDKGTNVIMLSSDDHIEIAVKSFKHGASDYVVKTETKFKKINYSLSNIFKILEAKKEAAKYKRMAYALITGVVILIAIGIILQIFHPGLL